MDYNVSMPDKKMEWSGGLSLGLELAVSVLIFAFLGYKGDQYFKTAPFLMVTGVFVGFIVGMWNIYRETINL